MMNCHLHPIIYDVAVSLDGLICGAGGDVSAFPHEGPIVDAYLARLATYRTAIMGRGTYEFGYRYGMRRGDNPYPHMRTIVVSKTLQLPESSTVEVISELDAQRIDRLRTESAGPVYLAGGGALAAHILGLGRIDLLRLKRAPVILGSGTPLFVGAAAPELLPRDLQVLPGGLSFQELTVVTL